jgi:predicted nucleic acid-binding protein
MRPRALIDTGAILALLDAREPLHSACAAALREVELPLVITDAVLAEVFHFLGHGRHMAEGWRFFRSGIVTLRPVLDDDMPSLEGLKLKYADLPMDLADATLVRLAQREGLATILSIDSDFEVYRIGGRKAFQVLPGR